MKPRAEDRPSRAGRLLALPVRFYRRFLSPLKPPSCRFHPTCSAYAEEALALHGVLRGGGLALWRILRCQPLCKGGLDPVPGSRLEQDLRACADPGDVDTPPSARATSDAPEVQPGRTR